MNKLINTNFRYVYLLATIIYKLMMEALDGWTEQYCSMRDNFCTFFTDVAAQDLQPCPHNVAAVLTRL